MMKRDFRWIGLSLAGLLICTACSDDGPVADTNDSAGTAETGTGDGDGDTDSETGTSVSTGDGDGDATGDGDGDPATGDGDGDATGDGDGDATGDGDGDATGDGDGDATGDGDGDMTGDGDGDMGGDGDGDMGGDGDGDMAGDGDGDPPDPIVPWLLHVRNDNNQLVKIDTDTGVETVICDFEGNVNYPSITFDQFGGLYGSRQGQELDEIDPCTCEVNYIGNMGYTGVNGITANGLEVQRLFGISIDSDVLLNINLNDANSVEIGNGLGINIGFSGSTFSNDILNLYAINADNDVLYQVDVAGGEASEIAPLDVPFSTVGIEWHPANGQLYACTNGHLYQVDFNDGTTMEIGNMGHGCNNLAAPWTAVQCIDEL